MSTSRPRGAGLGVFAGLVFCAIGLQAGAHEPEVAQEICTIDQDELVIRVRQELAPESSLLTATDQELVDAVLHIISHNPECVLEVAVAVSTVRPDAAFAVGTAAAIVTPELAEDLLAATRQVAAAPAAGPSPAPAAPGGPSVAQPDGPYAGPSDRFRLTPEDDDDPEPDVSPS